MGHPKYYLLILWILVALPGYGQPMPLSHAQFLEDLSVLETKLKQYHPNLYTYQTPKSLEAHLVSLRKERFPKYAAILTTQSKQPIRFDLQAEEGLAILTIGDFHRSVHRKAGQKFKKVIDDAMADLARGKVEHLIIDLRDNQGGDLQLGHYLLRYLLEEPFQTVDHFARVKYPEATSDVHRVMRSNNRLSREVEPRQDRYHGKVYLLTNGGSFSNSGIFSWMIRKHQRGLILGSATGGSSWQLCGGPNKQIRLPNSGIQVEIPKNRYALHPTGVKRGSIVPDKIIQPTAVDLAQGNDLVLDTVLTMIKSARNQ